MNEIRLETTKVDSAAETVFFELKKNYDGDNANRDRFLATMLQTDQSKFFPPVYASKKKSAQLLVIDGIKAEIKTTTANF